VLWSAGARLELPAKVDFNPELADRPVVDLEIRIEQVVREMALCRISESRERFEDASCLRETRRGNPNSRSCGSYQDEVRMIGIKTRSFLRRCPWIFHRDSRSVSIIN
jgi:hypothetical protein